MSAERRLVAPAVLLAAVSACAPVAGPAGGLPFLGSWACTGGLGPALDFTGVTYTEGGQTLNVVETASYGPNYTLDLADGSRVTLFDVTGTTLTWHRPATGESRDCTRIP
ncbi:hypothetical protein [Wenxinia saemankumensis]|uniref:Uncharacterized protein n=1 Tax=Wenxinia saemankumensis TaxID=1447782 RepID=A0A1M6E048_9RHOB|nr:hypothetical protein [Wenxinia saemankumensis]SHI78779.1 hypothetical protein SAMN05444417_1712 [Wenxinia saemankumensis]